MLSTKMGEHVIVIIKIAYSLELGVDFVMIDGILLDDMHGCDDKIKHLYERKHQDI